MKKTASISFLFLILTCQFGHYLLFVVQQWRMKEDWEQRMFRRMPESMLTRVDDSSSVKWEEEEKEFRLGRDLYDVVNIRIECGKKIYFAMNDRQENELIHQLDRVLSSERETPDGRNEGKPQLKFPFSHFTIPDRSFFYPICICDTQLTEYSGSTYQSIPGSVPHCPPWA